MIVAMLFNAWAGVPDLTCGSGDAPSQWSSGTCDACAYNATTDAFDCDASSVCGTDAGEFYMVEYNSGKISFFGECGKVPRCCSIDHTQYAVDSVTLQGTDQGDTLGFLYGGSPLGAPVEQAALKALGGNDTIEGSTVHTTEYHESLYGDEGNDNISGNNGNDVIDGGPGDDILHGDEHSDTIYTGTGKDEAYGDDGFDTIVCEGTGVVRGGDQPDTLSLSTAGNCSLFGEGHGDTITGNDLDNWMVGGDGNDTMEGFGGEDDMWGNAGDDLMWGGTGNDSMYGGDNEDTMFGGDGDDTVNGQGQGDFVAGGYGDDLLIGGFGSDELCETEADLDGNPATAGVNDIYGDKLSSTDPNSNTDSVCMQDIDGMVTPVHGGNNTVEVRNADVWQDQNVVVSGAGTQACSTGSYSCADHAANRRSDVDN